MTDKQTVMSWLEGLAQDGWPMFHSESEVRNTAKAALELLKLSEPVRHGHWNGWTATHWTKKCDDDGDPIYKEHKYYQCSECRRRTVIKSAYCPACGCRMDDELPY